MAANKDNLWVFNFSAYTMPDFNETRGKEYISYGKENDYPAYLLKCFQQSSKHNAIVTGKVDYIIGDGWKGAQNVQEFIKSPNDEENLKELSSKIALDIEIFGGCYIEIIEAKTAKGRKQYRQIPFNRIRTNEDMTKFFYSRYWTDEYGKMVYNPESKEGWKTYPAYDPGKSQSSSIYYYQCYTPKDSKYPVYPLPEYIGALPYIELDHEIANFHLNNVKNSFIGSFLINFLSGRPTDEKKKEIERLFMSKFAGTENSGKFVMNFSDSKERGVEITPLNPPDLDKMFIILNDMVRQEIFTGHKVTSPMLFGVKEAGQLGGRTELLDAYELFYNTYIRNRKGLLENIFNYLFVGNRESQALQLKEKPPLSNQLTLADLPNLTNLFTPQELRDIVTTKYNIEIKSNEPIQLTPVEMKAEINEDLGKRILQKLSKVGRPKDEFIIWKTRFFTFNGDYDAVETRMQKMLFASPLSGKVKDEDGAKVLEILDKNPDATPKEIAKELNIKESKINDVIKELTIAGYIDKGGITPLGDKILPPSDAVVSDISVMYAYAKDPTAPGALLIPTSREFCKDLVNMNKLFTRDEIEQISNEEDYSVFLFRGGWYHNPDTGDTTPYCRHQWQSVIVTEKPKAK